jgi:hypothetical protein
MNEEPRRRESGPGSKIISISAAVAVSMCILAIAARFVIWAIRTVL